MMLFAAVAVEVLFDFDSARIPEGTSDRLAEVVKAADANPLSTVIVDGNTDSVGSTEYNVGLSLRRASSVKAQLVRLGVESDRIIVVGYGEDGLRRSLASLDRRVTVWTSENPLYTIIDHALLRATTLIWDEPVSTATIEGPRATQTAFR